jgi:hypothetical protein
VQLDPCRRHTTRLRLAPEGFALAYQRFLRALDATVADLGAELERLD